MINMLDTQDKLKNFSEAQLIQEMQTPTGSAPQFMVLGEIERRKRMRQDAQRQEGLMQPTVAQEAVNAAGVPQQGIAQIAQSIAPQTDAVQNTGVRNTQAPMKMAGGGRLRGAEALLNDPAIIAMANQRGMSVQQFLAAEAAERPEGITAALERIERDRAKERRAVERATTPMAETSDAYLGLPTQDDLDLRYKSDTRNDAVGIGTIPSRMTPPTVGTMDAGIPGIDSSLAGSGTPPFLAMPAGRGTDSRVGGSTTPATPGRSVGAPSPAETEGLASLRGVDSTQQEIDRLRAIIRDPGATRLDKVAAAENLKELQESIAVRQTGGNVDATAEGRGMRVPEGYMMTALGIQRDPSYRSPGKTGDSLIDQAAMQGAGALANLAESGAVDPTLAESAKSVAARSDYEADLYGIDSEVSKVQSAIDNPYIDDTTRADMERFLSTAERQRADLVRSAPGAVTAGPASNVLTGYEGLVAAPPTGRGAEEADAAIDRRMSGDQPVAPADSAEAAAQAIEEAQRAITAPSGTGGGISGGGGGISGGGAGSGSMDSRIEELMAKREKQADQDKWLALAQVGLNLMSSTNRTFGGALGEAGAAGLAALQKSKASAQDFETDMLKLQSELDLNRARIAAANRSGRGGAKMAPASLVTAAASRLRSAQSMMESAAGGTPAQKQAALDEYNDALANYNDISRFVGAQYGYTGGTSAPAGTAPPNLGDSANK